jgi:hypothetical protein
MHNARYIYQERVCIHTKLYLAQRIGKKGVVLRPIRYLTPIM